MLACSTHVGSCFLGLEILSVSLYGLIAYLRHRRRTASAFLIFGIALPYAESGSLAFDGITVTEAGESLFSLVTVGLTLVVVGVGVKLALVPFHVWTPVAAADREFELRRVSASGQAVLALLVVALVMLGVYPTPLLAVLQAAV